MRLPHTTLCFSQNAFKNVQNQQIFQYRSYTQPSKKGKK
jgi:hypothetical protein